MTRRAAESVITSGDQVKRVLFYILMIALPVGLAIIGDLLIGQVNETQEIRLEARQFREEAAFLKMRTKNLIAQTNHVYVDRAASNQTHHDVSAEKRIRQTARRTAVNRARLSRIRTFVKKVETAIAARDKDAARAAFAAAQPELQSGALKGVLHRNTVARKLSRLSARIKAL